MDPKTKTLVAIMNGAVDEFAQAMEAVAPAIEEARQTMTEFGNTAAVLWRSVERRLEGATAPLLLAQRDRRGRNVFRGKARRRLKLLRSQYRRGLL